MHFLARTRGLRGRQRNCQAIVAERRRQPLLVLAYAMTNRVIKMMQIDA